MSQAPFHIDFLRGDTIVSTMNGDGLMNFERYRPKGNDASSIQDATGVKSDNLWDEKFSSHSDSKPRGPAAVGMDVNFPDAKHVVGLPEHATHLDMPTFPEPYRLYNLDVFEYDLHVPMALYGAVPMVTALTPPKDGRDITATGFFWVNPSETFVQPQRTEQKLKTWWVSESGIIDSFMFLGNTPEQVLSMYHSVTGFPIMAPQFAQGKHQCRWNYRDEADVAEVDAKFDQYNIPYDVIWLDIEHTAGKKYFTWDQNAFGTPSDMLRKLDHKKRKVVTIVDPHIKKEEGYYVFEDLKNAGVMTKTKDKIDFDGWCWPGTSYYPDFTSNKTRTKWSEFFLFENYKGSLPNLFTWNDMNEPSVFNGPEVSMPRDNLHMDQTGGWTVEHRDVHNVYGFYHHMGTVQGQLLRDRDQRPFVLTRSFFAGTQRLGAIWTGDNMAQWDHIEVSVPMLLSMATCGLSFVGADVGGFFKNVGEEMITRWYQIGIWYPFFRNHAHLETQRREPYVFGQETMVRIREAVHLRYKLLPYWYTLNAEFAAVGSPMIRPIYHDFLNDGNTLQKPQLETQMMVGSSIMVKPIAAPNQKETSMYLPKNNGGWFDWYSDKHLAGGTAVDPWPAPMDSSPVAIRAGSIIPVKLRHRRCSGAASQDPMSLRIYNAEGATATGNVYIDDENSFQYQQGEYVYQKFEFDGETISSSSLNLSVHPAIHQENDANFEHAIVESTQRITASDRRLHLDSLVLIGLSQDIDKIEFRAFPISPPEELVFYVNACSGDKFCATVKKPPGLIGDSKWTITVSYSAPMEL